MNSNDDSASLLTQIADTIDAKSSVRIVGGNSKAMLGGLSTDDNSRELSTLSHSGIIQYEPTELVVSVRAGTALADLKKTLSESDQMLPFDPPTAPASTIGGVLACGLSGPRRPFNGSARDYVLGMRIINGRAQDLSFGGEVMKNVAGYDVSRLQVSAWGTLGLLLDVSMKVLPRPEVELTLVQQAEENDTQGFAPFLRQPLPLSGAMLIDRQRYFRLSGSEAAVRAAASSLGGETFADGDSLWRSVRDQTHEFFTRNREQGKTLWRLSVADYTPALPLSGQWLHEWAGAQRWLLTDEVGEKIYQTAADAGGHAMRYQQCKAGESVFQPLHGAMLGLQSKLRDSFDPSRVFNRGRFHPELEH